MGTNSHVWSVEESGKWITEDSDRYMYDIDSEPMKKTNNFGGKKRLPSLRAEAAKSQSVKKLNQRNNQT